MLLILLGDYGSGKTSTAKYLVKKNGGVHLRNEMLTRGNVPLVEKLKKIMKPGLKYYLDGWNGHYHFADLPSLLNTEIKYIVCLAPPERVYAAQKKRGVVADVLPRPIEAIRITTQHAANIALTYDEEPIFADTTTFPVTFWNKKNWLTRWMEINLYGQFYGKGEYQDLELDGRYITGLSKSYKTWDRIKTMVDFNGKSVVDYGCNYGYFSFKAEAAGAVDIIAVDALNAVVVKARSIAMTKYSKVHFVISDLKKYKPDKADIFMALNTLHHLKYDAEVMKGIFSNAREVILELPVDDLIKVDKVARLFGFGFPVTSNSHRQGRVISVYSHLEKKPITPKKYTYNPKREAVKWWLIRTASKYFPRRIKAYVWSKIR